jgi:hypothetical protein
MKITPLKAPFSLKEPLKGVRSTQRQARFCVYTGVPLWVSHIKKPLYLSVFKKLTMQYQKA